MAFGASNQSHEHARALIGAGRHLQAIGVLEQLRKKPGGKKDPELLASLAECYMSINEVDKALDAVDKAIKLDPRNPRHRTNRGHALLHTRYLDQAAESFRAALRLNKSWAPALLGLTETLYLLGDQDEAYQALEPLLKEERVMPMVDRAFGRMCAGLGRADEGIARLERWVHDERVAPAHRMPGLFMLGSLYDKQKRHDDAFLAYAEGNKLRPGSFDPAKRRARTDRVIAGSSREALAHIPSPTTTSQVPVFIVGMPRSGTSLVEQILSSHPKVFGAGELTAIDMLVDALQNMNQAGMSTIEVQGRIDALASGYLGLLKNLGGNAPRITDKNPMNFSHLGIISRIFPGSRVIHCLRNPIDTCVSCYFHNFMGQTAFTDDLAGLGSYYNDYRRLMEHWSQVVEIPILDVEYEDVVADLESNARRMLEFLGLEWDPAVLKYNETERVTKTASTEQVRQPIYKSSVERWRRYEQHLGPLLEALEPRFRPGT